MKKTLLYAILVSLATLVISGCSTDGKLIKPQGAENLRIYQHGNKIIDFQDKRIRNANGDTISNVMIPSLKYTLHKASRYGLDHGYRYMALVNTNINNLAGSPINNWQNLKTLIELNKREHFRSYVFKEGNDDAIATDDEHAQIKVFYLKNRPSGMFLWDLNKLYNDTM